MNWLVWDRLQREGPRSTGAVLCVHLKRLSSLWASTTGWGPRKRFYVIWSGHDYRKTRQRLNNGNDSIAISTDGTLKDYFNRFQALPLYYPRCQQPSNGYRVSPQKYGSSKSGSTRWKPEESHGRLIPDEPTAKNQDPGKQKKSEENRPFQIQRSRQNLRKTLYRHLSMDTCCGCHECRVGFGYLIDALIDISYWWFY